MGGFYNLPARTSVNSSKEEKARKKGISKTLSIVLR